MKRSDLAVQRDRVELAFRPASRHVSWVEAPGFSPANSGRHLFGLSRGYFGVSYQGTTSQLADKVEFDAVLKGRSFSCAVQVLYFCHSSRTSVRGESAFRLFPRPRRSCRTAAFYWKGHGFSRAERRLLLFSRAGFSPRHSSAGGVA